MRKNLFFTGHLYLKVMTIISETIGTVLTVHFLTLSCTNVHEDNCYSRHLSSVFVHLFYCFQRVLKGHAVPTDIREARCDKLFLNLHRYIGKNTSFMKAQLIFLLSFFSATAFAQKIKEPEGLKIEPVYFLKDSGFTTPLNKVFYKQAELLRIRSREYPDLSVTITNGKISEVVKGEYGVWTDTLIGKVTLRVYKNKDTIPRNLIAIRECDIVSLPAPKCYYAGLPSGDVSRTALLEDSMIHINYDSIPVPFIWYIKPFTISFLIDEEHPVPEISSVDPSLDDQWHNDQSDRYISRTAKSRMGLVPLGTKMYFKSIRLQPRWPGSTDSGMRSIKIEDMTFTIVKE